MSDQPTTLADMLGLDDDPYLSHLTTLPLPTLLAEPALLKTQSHHLSSSLSALTQASYPTFLSLHQASAALDTSIESFSSSLDALVHSSLPNLDNALTAWSDRTDPVLRDRNRARLVLDQHDKLRDLLDVPLLIDTCVRNGYFAEALSLAAHASASLSASSSQPPNALLRSLRAELHLSTTHMLLALLSTLHEPHRKLPALFKVVSFLRKMAVFDDDTQIAVAFLGGREACLKASLDACARDVQALILAATTTTTNLGERDRDDLAKYLRKHIDLWREGVHDIITQYTTIFLDRDPSHAPALHTLLTTYASHALTTHLLPPLRPLLPLVPSAHASLLTQLTYCATAFARVGMDFRLLLADIFSDAVLQSVSKDLHEASHRWAARLKPTPKPAKPSQWLVSPSHTITTTTLGPSSLSPTSTQPHIPPPTLASYPPLATFLNAIITSFNALRLLAPVPILPDLLRLLDTILAQGLSAFTAYARTATTTTTTRSSSSIRTDSGAPDALEREEKETRVVCAVGDAYIRVFVPYVRRALVEGVYGADAVGEEHHTLLGDAVREWEAWAGAR